MNKAIYRLIRFSSRKPFNCITRRIIGYMSCIVLILCILCACVKEGLPDGNSDIQFGDRVPVFTVNDGQGNSFSSVLFTGKRSLLVLFHTGCKDCRRELPVVNEVYEALKGDENCQVVTIAREESRASVLAYWEGQSFSMPFFLDPDRAVFSLFATSTIPRFYLIDAAGIVQWLAIETLDGMTAAELLQMVKG